MPSSTSVSERQTVRVGLDRFTIVLLGTIVVVLMFLEIVSRERFDSSSKVEQREMSERAGVLAIRDSAETGEPHIVLLGNSLMLEGVEVPLLKAKIAPGYVPTMYFVLGTNYYDWFYGLKRLFAEGMRPRYIMLGLSPNQLATSEVRGDISAHYMIQQSDLLDLVRQSHMDATRASEFALAHYSAFYSIREVFRGYVMSRVFPSVADLLHSRSASFREPEVNDSEFKPLAAQRLAALNRLCETYGAHFLFVVPPTYQQGEEAIVAAGREDGVTVLLPVKRSEFDQTYYQKDGFHMNQKGAEIFTARVAAELNKELP
jgi:hypothetical protein